MSAIRWIVFCASMMLAGCGLRVPEIQENPFSPGDGQLMVQSIVQAPTDTGGILKTNVLSHDVKFDLVTSGGVTPAWKLTTATVNQSGTLFSTSRDLTHDLIITLGPGDKTGFTTDAPRNADAAQQIGNAVSTNLKLLGQ